MKTILATASVLTLAVVTGGFALDASVVLAIGFAAGIAGIFARDYNRTPRYNLDPVKAPQAARRQVERGVEFATFATFHTMVG
jgi:hypothetical protein